MSATTRNTSPGPDSQMIIAVQKFTEIGARPLRLNDRGKKLRGKNFLRAVLIMRQVEAIMTTGVPSASPTSPAAIAAAGARQQYRMDTAMKSLVESGEVAKLGHKAYVYKGDNLRRGLMRLALDIEQEDDDEPP